MSGLKKSNLSEVLRLYNVEKLSQRSIAKIIGCGRTTVQDFLLKKTHKKFWDKYDQQKFDNHTHKVNKYAINKKYVICCAQSNTYLRSKFFDSIKTYADYNNAEILISTCEGSHNIKEDVCYPTEIANYVCNVNTQLAKDLTFCAELSLPETLVNPTGMFKRYNGDISIIIPHTKQDLLCVPSDKGLFDKNVYSTGCVTLGNYRNNGVGARSEEDHIIGALLVDVDDDGFSHVRQIQSMSSTGEFYDLDKLYTPENVLEDQTIEAINWGDIHAAQLNSNVADASWIGDGNLLDWLKPKYQFANDSFDMLSRNHHNRKNQFSRLLLEKRGRSSVEEEIELTVGVLKSMERDFSQVVIVESNHDKALEKWLDEADYRLDDVNATYFLKLQYARYKWLQSQTSVNCGDSFQVFKYACEDKGHFHPNNFKFLQGEPFIICNSINCGQHGDRGNNGARGSINAYRNRTIKYNIGHGHSPSIRGNVFMAGVSSELFMGYNTGADAWRHAHIITYKNGARSLIFI